MVALLGSSIAVSYRREPKEVLAVIRRESLLSRMNKGHEEAACEPPTIRDQHVDAGALAYRSGTVSTPVLDLGSFPRRILVVDDDREICSLCADALTCSDYRVDTAADAIAAWQALHACNYCLLLTDSKMPMVSGIELIAKLRSARMDPPVVLASSAIPMEEINRNPSLRLAATLLEPLTIAELLDTVGKVLTADSRRNRPGNSVSMLVADAHWFSPIAQSGTKVINRTMSCRVRENRLNASN
jgi:CheY-like chemotaxis protein